MGGDTSKWMKRSFVSAAKGDYSLVSFSFQGRNWKTLGRRGSQVSEAWLN